MTPIQYIQGDATQPVGKGNKIIAHVSNDIGGWGKGFVLAISRRWSEPEQAFRRWHRERASNDYGLGSLQIVSVSDYVWVANMIGQCGVKAGSKGPPVRYEAIESCLAKLSVEAAKLQASVHLPRIGCGLAGGKWDKVEPLIKKTLCENGVPVTVYDYEA